jgi:hypothetical protein
MVMTLAAGFKIRHKHLLCKGVTTLPADAQVVTYA